MSMEHWWRCFGNYALFYYYALLKYAHYRVYIQSMCVIYYFREFEDMSAYAAFWLFTPSLDRDLSLRLYSVPHRHAAHRHVPGGCMLVLVNIAVELTHQSVQMF